MSITINQAVVKVLLSVNEETQVVNVSVTPMAVSVPTGGLEGQVLAKASDANYDFQWVEQQPGGAANWGGIGGTLSDQADLQEALDVLETSIEDIEDIVEGGIVEEYPIDFTPMVSTGDTGEIFVNDVPVENAGKLTALRVKVGSIGTPVTPYVYEIVDTGSGYESTLIHTYATFEATALVHTEEISDPFEIQPGQYIGVKVESTVYYAFGGHAFKVEESGTSDFGLMVAQDFTITTIGLVDGLAALGTRVDTLEDEAEALADDVADLEAEVAALSSTVQLKPCLLYTNKFNDFTGLTNTTWVTNANGTSPAALGSRAGNYLWLQRMYHVEEMFIEFKVILHDDTIFTIDANYVDYKQGDGKFRVNAVNSTLKIFNVDNPDTENEVASVAIPFAIIDGGHYIITLQRTGGWISIFTITEPITKATVSVTYGTDIANLTLENRQMDTFMFYQDAGGTYMTLMQMDIFSKGQPLIYLTGDSITEGVYFSSATYSNRYGVQLKAALNGDLIHSARGGADQYDLELTVDTEVQFIRPKYVMMTIGTNGGIVVLDLIDLVNHIINDYGCQVILNHVPNRADDSHLVTNANIDLVIKGTNAIKGALFDVATSIDGDVTNGYIADAYFDAGVHPNSVGQTYMYERFAIDCPFLFI